ncbi:MAG: hypothetical protein GDA49_02195 [Rhodospirillales bacterium]|nr:hypothetical protein [Rhodospirillales bacterium]
MLTDGTMRRLLARKAIVDPAAGILFRKRDGSVVDIVANCCEAWNRLINDPERMTSIGSRNRANRF